MADYDVLFDGTAAHGRYLNDSLNRLPEPHTAPPVVRQDDRGRPAYALDILGVLNAANQPITKTEIMQRTGSSRERVSQELDKLIAVGQVQRTAVSHRGNIVVYSAVR